jgi:iron complex outermembrane receptor protein
MKLAKNNKSLKRLWLCLFTIFILMASPAWSHDATPSQKPDDQVHKIGQVVVTAKEEKGEVIITPPKTTIDIDNYQPIETPLNVGDYLKDLILFDFRGETDLVPGSDSFEMRTFGSSRFVVAVDGLNLRKTGGRKGSHIVDYAYLPPFLIDRIEVLPGPHSALFPAKAMGGVVNVISRAPKVHESPVPDIKLSGSYRSYNTQNYNLSAQGSASQFTYDFGYQYYSTGGYLRNSEAEINTFISRLGYVIPSGGHIALTGSYSDNQRNTPVNNDPSNAGTQYDDDYPVVTGSAFNANQDPTWDGNAFSFRADYQQPLPIGDFSTTAYYSEEHKDRSYYSGGSLNSMYTRWYNQGAKIQDVFSIAPGHKTTFEIDGELCYDGGRDDVNKERRISLWGAGLQHEWQIIPHLTLTLGMRYEGVNIRVQNGYSGTEYITGRGDWIERDFGALLPKSFLTYQLDGLAEALRDTSLSVGVSRIWRAPDFHGDYNPQGKPAGAWLDPEQGVGVDAVLSRRLFSNVQMKLSYYYYAIDDYMVSNSRFAKYTPSGSNKVTPGMEFSDYKINLDQVIRQGVELEVSGNILKNLSFYLGYAYQNLENQGDEPAGAAAASNEPENRIKAGLRFEVIPGTTLLLDYRFEDDQVNEYSEEIEEDVYILKQVAIDAHHLVDLGVRQRIFEKWGFAQNGCLRFFVNNLFNTEYEDSRGYPSTDRTFGVAFSFDM